MLIVIMDACCKGGTGGNATVVATIFHHTKAITGASVYVKYGAKDFPGTTTSAYSASITAANNSNTVTFKDLKCGDYFFYGVGFDSTLSLPVTGGYHLSIKHSERNQEKDFVLAISEE